MKITLLITLLFCCFFVDGRRHNRNEQDHHEHQPTENHDLRASSSSQSNEKTHYSRIGSRKRLELLTLEQANERNGSVHVPKGNHRKISSKLLPRNLSDVKQSQHRRQNNRRIDKENHKETGLRGLHHSKDGNAKERKLSRNYRRKVHGASLNSTSTVGVEAVCANVTCPHKQVCIVDLTNNRPLCVREFSGNLKPVQTGEGQGKVVDRAVSKQRAEGRPHVSLAARGRDTKDYVHQSASSMSSSPDQSAADNEQLDVLDAKTRAQNMKDRAKSFERDYEKLLESKKARLIHGNSSSSKENHKDSSNKQHDDWPPCLAALKAVPHLLVGGAPLLPAGAYVPACDSDGYYMSMQCASTTGQCWCADRLGNELKGTRVTGMAECG